jgi:hypothetical protein
LDLLEADVEDTAAVAAAAAFESVFGPLRSSSAALFNSLSTCPCKQIDKKKDTKKDIDIKKDVVWLLVVSSRTSELNFFDFSFES